MAATENKIEIDSAIDKGLEGIVACTTKISSIHDSTLLFRGYTIEDLAKESTFEEVIFLLWNDRLPNQSEFEKFKKEIVSSMELPNEIIQLMKSLPSKNVIPMNYLRTVISALSLVDQDAASNENEANLRKAIRLTGAVGAVVAGFNRIRDGKDLIKPDLTKNFSTNFLNMMSGKLPDEIIAKKFDTCLVLHADHELNCSAFAARVTTSSLSDMHSAVTSALAALKGPLHGGANEQVMKMLLKIGSVEATDAFIDDALKDKAKVMGIGHRVYKNGDPRAKILRKMSEELCKKTNQEKYYTMSARIDDIMFDKKGLMPNVDFYSATVYYCMGIPIDLYTPIFATSRIAGWIAHINEQYLNNRIYRPRGRYAGKIDQKYVSLKDRK